MAVKDYTDPRWQRVRLRILERDSFQCKACGTTKETLHVHHRAYQKKKKIWDSPDCDMVTLCETCHERAEEIVCSFREIADSIVHHERIGRVQFLIDERIRDVVSSKTTKNATDNYLVMMFDLLNKVTSWAVTSSEDFQKEDTKK